MPRMPKGRYKIMTDYMPKVGTLGLDMMYRTCTVQTNLDFSLRSRHGQEAARVDRAAAGRRRRYSPIRRSPRASPTDSCHSARKSGATPTTRAPACCPGRSSPAWVSSAGSIMRSTCRCISSSAATTISTSSGQSFRDLLAGRLPAMPGARATISDWAQPHQYDFPGGAAQALSGNARRRLRPAAEPAGAAGVLGRHPLRRRLRSTRLGIWSRTGAREERQKLRDDVPKLGLAATVAGPHGVRGRRAKCWSSRAPA